MSSKVENSAGDAICCIQDEVEDYCWNFLRRHHFHGIHVPKLIGGSSDGGSSDIYGLSQIIYMQMAIFANFERVFELGPVSRADGLYCVGLSVEMKIMDDYFELMDILDQMFVGMFDHLNDICKKELKAINRQVQSEPLKYLNNTLRLTYEDGAQMLKDAGLEVDPSGNLNTETEIKLGHLVFEKYETDFYILYRYPLAVRPFYTLPCYDDPAYSNSFDVFLRGEKIISGSQRVHSRDLLTCRARECRIDLNTLSTYIDSFRDDTPLLGGFDVDLERVVMLFCAQHSKI